MHNLGVCQGMPNDTRNLARKGGEGGTQGHWQHLLYFQPRALEGQFSAHSEREGFLLGHNSASRTDPNSLFRQIQVFKSMNSSLQTQKPIIINMNRHTSKILWVWLYTTAIKQVPQYREYHNTASIATQRVIILFAKVESCLQFVKRYNIFKGQ